ncbi:MAG: site-specific integrase [Desulfobacteraceae bacterium]|nr:MAG: site-specific integrase [Desulfobacteraceae bacterium]
MATIRKRGKGYQIDYFDPTGKRVRKSFKKKKDAEGELGKRVSLIAEKRYLDVKKEYKTTLGELITKYRENHQQQRSYSTLKKYCLDVIGEHFGEDTLLSNIRYVDLETFRNHLRGKLTMHGKIRSDASVNRPMACLRHMLTKAVEWDMAEENPFTRGKTLYLKENNQRIRYLTDDEIEKLLSECTDHIKDIVECALNTGMRKGEILRLKWDQIRNGFIYLREDTKSKKAREIPINDDMDALFKRIRKQQHLTSKNVFNYYVETKDGHKVRGSSIKDISRSFRSACTRAGIHDFHFHDLRHTFASHVIMKGGSLKDVQELLGHSSMAMTLRYSHLSQQHKRNAVNLLNGLTTAGSRKNSSLSQNVTFPEFGGKSEGKAEVSAQV